MIVLHDEESPTIMYDVWITWCYYNQGFWKDISLESLYSLYDLWKDKSILLMIPDQDYHEICKKRRSKP